MDLNQKETKLDQVFLSFRIKKEQKERFKLLSLIKGKSGVDLIMDYVNSELRQPLNAKQIRKMPKEFQEKIWKEQSNTAIEIFQKHKNLNDIPDTVDDIE
jgi:hypothetical protein